jgi:RNA polymerase sigma-70 factor (ECF subfamily)
MDGATEALPPGIAVLMLAMRDERPDFGKLIEAVAERRDRDAFAQLFEYFAPRLKAYLMRIGAPPAAAEDFAQEAMFVVWRKAALFDARAAGASTWIFTIARNLRIDALRRDGRGAPVTDVSLAAKDPARPDDILVELDHARRIRRALETLSDEQAKVVRLSFFLDKPHGEIARELGLPLGTVKSRLRLAVTRLRGVLGDLP